MNKTKTGAGIRMWERFAQLLHEFSVLAARSDASFTLLKTQISTLLKQFGEHRDRTVALERAQAAYDREHICTLLVGYNETVERYRRQQEEVADDFNLLDVMRLTGKEIRHSMVLAWLLDHDIRKLGTHAQGNLGFRLFLNEFGLPIVYSDNKYWVRREVAGDEAIVDIEVACRHQFLIHIENKIWSGEGTDQTDREWSDLQRRAAELNVTTPHVHGLFLTPHGMKPANPNFRAISWVRIVRVLEAFAERVKPPDVKLFTAHYARALRRFIVSFRQACMNHLR
jgi:PD-(D/E)XK nuclease superfamily